MAFTFSQAAAPQLLIGAGSAGGAGQVVAVVPAPPPRESYSLAEVLADFDLAASLVVLHEPVGSDRAAQDALVSAVLGLASGNRILAWAWTPQAVADALRVTLVAGGASGVMTNLALSVAVVPTLTMVMPSTTSLAAGDDAIVFTGPPITFQGVSAPVATVVPPTTMPLTGDGLGTLSFTLFVPQAQLAAMGWGFLFGAPPRSSSAIAGSSVAGSARPLRLTAPLAIADGSVPGLVATFDPLATTTLAPGRNAFAFLGTNLDRRPTALTSTYTTPSGNDAVILTPLAGGAMPARLVFAYAPVPEASPRYLALAPDGDFALSLASGKAAPTPLLAGLQATEYLVFQPGSAANADRLRFVPGPAYAPGFPPAISSPISPPPPDGGALLTTRWITAWALLLPASAEAPITSVAQPPGFALYGVDQAIHGAYPNLMGHLDPATTLAAAPSAPFPLVPYTAVVPGQDDDRLDDRLDGREIAAFEADLLGPLRRAALASDRTAVQRSARGRLHARAAGATTTRYATPSGYLFTMDGERDAAWRSILLAKLLDAGQQLALLDPERAVEDAFQSGQLLLVDANGVHLGKLGGDGADGTPAFANTLTLGDWTMAADVGLGSTFGDYANVLIVKGVRGPLYDPDGPADQNLVGNPSKWTMADTFSAPRTIAPGATEPGPPDPSQLANLAGWLQGYFAAAAANPDVEYFGDFNALARDPAWTGLLLLRGTIAGIPAGLAGITAGVTTPAAFNVHHLAVPLTPVSLPPPAAGDAAVGPDVTQSSSVSGLIYYLDPEADLADPTRPLPSDALRPYDFRLNSLRVRFAHSELAAFSSYAQVTMSSLFGSQVSGLTDATNTNTSIVLTGGYQLVDDQPVYSLTSTSDAPYLLSSGTLARVEVTGVQMATVRAEPTGITESAFVMGGFLDFAIVPGRASPEAPLLDLFGFGNLAGQTLPHQGLAFSNLRLTMAFPTEQPDARAFTLATDKLAFDLPHSTVRPGSLVDQFRLQLGSLMTSSATLPQAGFLPVIAMFPAGDLGETWNGLVFRLDLGGPGALAAAAGLEASLLLAWAPTQLASDGSGNRIGLELPGTAQGAPLISLQSVLKLSIGRVQLAYDATAKAYLLLLDQIALAFLGLLKLPPSGATSFYLFGDPSGGQTGLAWYAIFNNEPRALAR
jgi:hypothetical protein